MTADRENGSSEAVTQAVEKERGLDERAPDPRKIYRERAEGFFAARDAEVIRSRRIARLRFFVFVGAVVLFLLAERAVGDTRALLIGVGLLPLLGFLGLVVVHAKVRGLVERMDGLGRVNAEGESRLDRRWDDLPPPLVEGDPLLPPASHPFADDLDMFGRVSVFRLLSTVSTAPGRSTLARWLLEDSPPAEIPERQRAVRELAPLLDFRDGIAVEGRRIGNGGIKGTERFLEWAEDTPWLLSMRSVLVLSWILPILTIGLAVLHFGGWTPVAWWVLPLVASAVIQRKWSQAIDSSFDRAAAGEGGIRSKALLFEMVADSAFESPLLKGAREGMVIEDITAHEEIRRLRRLLDMSDLRLSMFHLPIHLVTFWDFHVLRAMEKWQRRAGPHVRHWIDGLGEIDALSALAALAHDHPEWTFPEIIPGEGEGFRPLIEARGIGHPLLHPSKCVKNDVDVGPDDTFLLVTGSNMSGKSTLLRAIGVNVVLGQAGGPVCADRLRLPPLSVHTSMRVADSLAEGLSHFMAELMRLKGIVEAARTTRSEGSRTFLYLLDELLQGTNTAERQIAARSIIGHLLDQGAIGAVTTHDLALADAPELNRRSHPVHFREIVTTGGDAPPLTFDYRLRPGIATSRNALKLMQLVGLDVDSEQT